MQLTVQCSEPMTLETYLRQHAGVSAHMLKRLKQVPDGITRGGVLVRSIDMVSPGDVLTLTFPESATAPPNPSLQVPVIYESPHVLVCNKPAGMPVHPSMLHHDDTLANWFAAYAPDSGFHLLNRLDRNTSGLCLIAKTAFAAHAVHDIEKKYYALVPPGLSQSGTVDAPIARERESVIIRCVRPDGKRAVTHYHVLQQTAHCTYLEIRLETGRTHQIRVHMAHLGYPLLGDDLYGGDCSRLSAHALHCGAIRFFEPGRETPVQLIIPLRDDMQQLLTQEEHT